MEPSHSAEAHILDTNPWFGWSALAAAIAAAIILGWYLWKKPLLFGPTKGLLFLGFGVLPIGVAISVNVASLVHMQHRVFCGSCHVMEPFTDDAANPESTTLASRHSRNASFGETSCYQCHQDYGMFGTIVTKIGGMRHVWYYYTEYQYYTVEEARPKIHINTPFPNSSCMHCHSTDVPIWREVDEHAAALEDVRSGEVSCASVPCHGPPHPPAPGRDDGAEDGAAHAAHARLGAGESR